MTQRGSQNLPHMWRSTFGMDAAQLGSVTVIAPKSLFSCVNRSLIEYDFRADEKAIWYRYCVTDWKEKRTNHILPEVQEAVWISIIKGHSWLAWTRPNKCWPLFLSTSVLELVDCEALIRDKFGFPAHLMEDLSLKSCVMQISVKFSYFISKILKPWQKI